MRRTTFTLGLLILVSVLLLLHTADILQVFVRKTTLVKAFTNGNIQNEARLIAQSDVLRDSYITVITDKYVKSSPSTTKVLNTEKTLQNVSLHNNDISNENGSGNVNLSVKLNTSEEVTHIAFLKVHKAASSTVQSIIQRFGLKRNLSFVIADSSHYISKQKSFFSDIWPPLPRKSNQGTTDTSESNKHDILCNHMVFNRKKISKLLYKDSKYIAIVREPFDQFLSAAFYYKFVWNFPYLVRLPNETFITDLIRNPNQTEATSMAESVTYNSMAYDFGLDFSTLKEAEKISEEKFKKFLNTTGETFHLVMLVEKFDESLVLLKRHLNWSLEDIIYIKTNTYTYKNKILKQLNLTATDKEIFRKRNKFDFALYNFFKDRFDKQTSREINFKEEVGYFKNILHIVQEYCEKEMSRVKAEAQKNETRNETQENNAYLKAHTTIKPENSVGQIVDYSRKDNITEPTIKTKKKLSGVTQGQNTTLHNVIISIIQTKKLTKEQVSELGDLLQFQDNDISMATVENLSKLLPLLFYNKEKPSGSKTRLLISKSKWNEEFIVTASDCKLMGMDELKRYKVVKETHLKHLVRRKFGDKFSVKEALSYVFSFY